MKLFLNTRNRRFEAVAEYDMKTGMFVVLKGSRVSDNVSFSPAFRGAKSVEKRRELFVKNCVVQEDVCFRSSSTAANFVTGNSTNGPSSWRDERGRKLKEILKESER